MQPFKRKHLSRIIEYFFLLSIFLFFTGHILEANEGRSVKLIREQGETYSNPSGYNGLHGYISFGTSSVPDGYDMGMGFYAAVWPLVPKPLANFQIGLPSAWIIPNNRDNPNTPLCPEGTYARDNWPERGPTWHSVFQTVEGGLGYWAGNRFRYGPPKFSMNGTPQCYDYEVASPGWSFFHSSVPLSDDRLGVAQLSNRLLIPPDGLTFNGDPNGEIMGYSWMALPLTAAKPGNQPTGDQSWTCFLNASNFKGPIAYYLPETWSKIADLFDYPFDYGRGLDARPGIMGGGAMEINTVPFFKSTDSSGTIYTKIPQLQFPVDNQGRSFLVRDVTYYSKSALYNAVEAWRENGSTASGKFSDAGKYRVKLYAYSTNYDQEGITLKGIDDTMDTQVYDSYSWGLEWTDTPGFFPQYFKQDGSNRVAVSAVEVPDETGLKSMTFPEANFGSPYVSPMTGAWERPGPASGEHYAYLADGTKVTYRWYRFVDQPVFQQYNWTTLEKEKLQSLVEKIHTYWGINDEYMSPPSEGSLATLDSSLIVTPPSGFSVGYVPIVTRQEYAPQDNDDPFDQLTLNDLLGEYVRQPPANSWHSGEISMVGNSLQWENEAEVSWPLIPILEDGKLLTNEQCPYHDANGGDAFSIVLKQDDNGTPIAEVEGFQFLGELYTRQAKQLSNDDVVGQYVRQPATNSWHSGTISMAGNSMQWENEAGVTWTLIPNLTDRKLFTNEECHYSESVGGGAFSLILNQNETEVESFQFLGEFYLRQ